MKKVLICTFLLMLFLNIDVFGNQIEDIDEIECSITINGDIKEFNSPIYLIDGKTYVPLREVFEFLGFKVEWRENMNWSGINIYEDDSVNWLMYRENDKYGYMDQNGRIIFEPQFDFAYDFIDGTALVGNHVDNWLELPSGKNLFRWGFINSKGEFITPIKFLDADEFSEGLALVREEGSETYYYIDKNGNRSNQKVISYYPFTSGYAPKLIGGGYEGPPIPDPPTEIWSYIDINGNLATDKTFEVAGEFNNGMAIVKNEGKYGVINTELNYIIDCRYDDMNLISDKLFAAKSGDKWAIVNDMGDNITEFMFFYIGEFSEDLAPVRMSIDDAAYIDKNGNILLDNKFKMTYEFVGGYACVKDRKTDKYGVINKSGQYIINPVYDSLMPSKPGVFEVHENGSDDYYFIKTTGEKIIPYSVQ